jgi:hypothetical protein
MITADVLHAEPVANVHSDHVVRSPVLVPTPEPIAELDRLGDQIAELSAHLDAATARLLDLIREFDARGGWSNGFRSCAEWLTWRIGLDPGAARERVRVARALGTLPRLAQALARGELSYSKVRALTRVATPDTEEQLLAVGRAGTAHHVELIVRGWRRVDRKAEVRETSRRHRSRWLQAYPGADGMVVIRGQLEPEVGAVVLKALAAAQDILYLRRHTKDVSAETRADDTADTWEQQQADALAWSPRQRCITASIPARPRSATRWWSTSTRSCWRTPSLPDSRSWRTERTFLQKRRSGSRATRLA